jgi:hypothetical protein
MAYYTTVIVVNSQGKPVKAEVYCGGTSKGFTDPNTGKINFTMNTTDQYSVSASHYGESASGKVRGGEEILLRLR